MKNFNIRLILAIFLLSLLAFTCKEDNPVEPARNGSIEGHVIEDSSGLPVMNANIYTVPATSNVTTNQYGDYFIKYVPYAEYKVYCYKTGFDTASVSVSLDTGAVANADFSLLKSNSPFGSIKVTAKDLYTNLPIENLIVSTDPASYILTTDAGGVCLFENLRPGTYTLASVHKDYDNSSVSVAVKEGVQTPANIFLKAKTVVDTSTLSNLYGKVIDKISGNGIAGVYIYSVPATGSVLSDANGNYKLKYILPGNYKVIAEKNDYTSDTVDVVLQAGLTTSATMVLKHSTGTITGRVFNSTLSPIAGVGIKTIPFTESKTTDSNGSFSLVKIDPGSYKLIASKSGYISDTLDVSVTAADTSKIELVLDLE